MDIDTAKQWLTSNGDWIVPLGAIVAIVTTAWVVITGAWKNLWRGFANFWRQGHNRTSVGVHPARAFKGKEWREFALACEHYIGHLVTSFAYWNYYITPCLNYEVPSVPRLADEAEFHRMKSSTVWFADRFSEAFPGIREVTEFSNRHEIAHRLGILLRAPLFAEDGRGSGRHPVWWTRGGYDMHISLWYRLKPRTFLMDIFELNISKMVAIPGAGYWQCFVYLECEPQRSTGIYGDPTAYVDSMREKFHFASEEYCVYRFGLYNRQEYDDGGYSRNGKVRRFGHRPNLRSRHLTKYNFLIVAASSPAQHKDAERGLRELLNGCLENNRSVNDLATWLLQLPRNERR